MNFNYQDPIEKRLAENLSYYYEALKQTNIDTLKEQVNSITNEFLNDTLSKKMSTSLDAAGDRMPLKYKTNMALHYGIIGEDLEYTLLLFDKLTNEIQKRQSYTYKSVQETVHALITLNKNDLITLMLSFLSDEKQTFHDFYELLDAYGYKRVIELFFAIIAASLVEILLIVV